MDIESDTLGQKHKNLNKAVQHAIENNPNQKIEDINYNQPDMDNLFKIELACRTRNVDYLLKVFKCEDMLYVSRAIKHSVWLITDPQYAHIINPIFLHSELFPYMMTAAKNKLLYSIRLNLKDTRRNEEFLNYLKDVDLNMAMKWFPRCSSEFISGKIEEDIYRIPDNVLLRLFSVSTDTLKSYIKNYYWKKPMLEKAMFVISKYGEKYFDVLDSVEKRQLPQFNAKYTKLAMKHCPRRLMFKFDRYISFIDETTFVKYINFEYFQEFLTKNASNKRIKVLFPEEKCEKKILKLNNHNTLLSRILECSNENFKEVKIVLYILRNKYLQDLKFRLHLLNIIIKKFLTHRFDTKTWNVLNDIYIRIGAYSEYKKHFKPCIKSAISYHVVNNSIMPPELISNFHFYTFKQEQNKFNEEEKNKMFNFLYQFAINNLDETDNEKTLVWLDNILILLKDWSKDWMDYSEVTNEIRKLLEPIKETSNVEAILKLYNRNRVWRKVLFHETFLININENSCMNALKHDPKIIYQFRKEVTDMCLKEESMKKFLKKSRIYWPQSLAKKLKSEYEEQLPQKPNKNLYLLLTKQESFELMQSNIPQDIGIDWNKLYELDFRKHIVKNIHIARPKPSMDMILLYSKGVYLKDSFSSIKAILHNMSPHKTTEYIIKLQNWPECVLKLCVLQAFTKCNKNERNEMILNIWNNTHYCSVRADIFKLHYKALRKYTVNDMNKNDAYKETIEERWSMLKQLIASLRDNESIIIYNLLSKFEKMPISIRTEYCILSYKFLKSLPKRLNCSRFMNNIVSKIEYNKVLLNLEIDLIAEMVEDTIINRIWTEKLDWTFLMMLIKCLTSHKENCEITFEKIFNPVLKKAYEMWDVNHQGLFITRYNIYNFVYFLNGTYKDILKQMNSPTPLQLLLDSFQSNLNVRDNRVIITTLKLAVEYINLLSKYEKRVPHVFEETVHDLSKISLDVFCNDINLYGHSVLIFYFHSLQMVLSGFEVPKKTQYKLFNCMLDMSKDLSSDMNILVHKLVLEHCFYVDYSNGDKKGRKMLHERIKAHPSSEVKANYSKVMITDACSIPYYSFMYFLLKDKL